ncbi:MAG: hypothetical protein CVT49_02320 [candidate division Zixibacteria bacterium HGW-Zixibacteria-1]|nr:MAG: hypothetical protein CVT49_02320 [candidate division Zixibacteria bacterium HGW-Zixibacteria-1]
MAVSAKLRAAGLTALLFCLAAAGATGSDTEPLGYDSLSALSRIVTSIDTTETQNYVRIADRIYPALWEEDNNINYTLNDLFQSNNYQLPTNKSDYALTPEYLGSALWTFAHDIRVENDVAYVCFGPGLALFDVSNPADPQLLSRYYMQKGTGGIDIANGYLFMADPGRRDEALWKYDISDPYNIELFDSLYAGRNAWTVKIDGNQGYLCAQDSGLYIFNAFYYNDMIPLGNYLLHDSRNIVIRGDTAFAIDEAYESMTTLDVHYASYPTRMGSIATDCFATDVGVVGNYAFVSRYNGLGCAGLLTVDISDVYHPTAVAFYNQDIYYDDPWDVEIKDNVAYVTMGGYPTVHIIDISDPLNPTKLGWIINNGDSWGMDISGDYAYITGGYSGVWVADIAQPEDASIIDFINFGKNDRNGLVGYLIDVELQDNYAYVSVEGAGLTVLDISDPANPVVMGNDGISNIVDLAVQGNYAYVAQTYNGFRICDITDPSNPHIISNYRAPGYVWDVSVKGDYAFAAADTSGLQICDISDPYNITRVGYYNDIYFGGHEAYSIDVAGDYAYLGDRTGLVIINITDPANPVPAGEKLYTSGMVREVKVRGDYAYLADAGCGMRVVDISDPAHPVSVGIFDELCDVPCDIALYGKYAYIANGTCIGCEVKIVDISNPSNMSLAGVYETPGECVNGIATDGQNIYVADAYGFFILNAGIDYVCGDATNDGAVNLLDAVYMIDYLYKNGEPMAYSDAGDTDGSGAINLLDIAYLINYLYKNGPAPWC